MARCALTCCLTIRAGSVEETPAERRRRKEKARLREYEKVRVRSRAKVPGRGRGRPPKSATPLPAPSAPLPPIVQPLQSTCDPRETEARQARSPVLQAEAVPRAAQMQPPCRCDSCGATHDLEADPASGSRNQRVYYCRMCWAWWRAQGAARVQCAGVTDAGTRCRISSWDEHSDAQPLWEGHWFFKASVPPPALMITKFLQKSLL